MKTFSTKQAALILVLLILAGVSFFAAYQIVLDWPGRQIIHAYMEAKGINIRPGTPEYKIFMRQVVWGEFPELRQISDFVKTQEELDAVSRYAFKYSGYRKLYGKYQRTELPEVKALSASPTASRMPSLVIPTATTLEEMQHSLGTPSPTYPKATATPKPTEVAYLIAHEPMIVRYGPDITANVIGQIPADQAYPVIAQYSDWYLIDLGNDQNGWVYGATNATHLDGNRSLVPTLDITPMPFITPTPLCTPQSVKDIEQVLDDAQSTLVAFFDLLNRKEYARAAEFFGGDYYILRNSNPLVDPNDYFTLFQHACEINGFQCLQIKRVVNRKAILPYQYEFIVEFKQPDGSLFVRGPCCGADETQQPPESRWKYTVVLDCTGKYYVMELPPYIP